MRRFVIALDCQQNRNRSHCPQEGACLRFPNLELSQAPQYRDPTQDYL